MCLRKILDFFFGSRNNYQRPDGPIKHVILLMFENHSFDQMLGCFRSIYPQLTGVDPAHPRSNRDSAGQEYFQKEANDTVIQPDPNHEVANVRRQLQDGNSGFVADYEEAEGQEPTTPPQRQRIMDYFGMDCLPALHALAKHFTICDQWYSSVPGPTWTNRFFAYSGTSLGLVDMPSSILHTNLYLNYTQDTIFDRLNEKRFLWRVYFGDVPNSLVLRHQWTPRNAFHYYLMSQFFEDVKGPEAKFPAFTLIEPTYMIKGEQNDDHPPHSAMRAQVLVGNVYNALRRNEPLWNSTLLVVVYDEHGGFYDQEPPQTAVPPDAHHEQYTFDRFGVRVPALLISPWVERGVFSTRLDHTSLLRYLIDAWKLKELTARVQAAASFSAALRSSARTDTPPSVPVPVETTGAVDDLELAAPMNKHQQALHVFAEHLASQTQVPPVDVAGVGPGLLMQGHIAKSRVLAFLEQQKKTAAGAP